MVYRCGWACEQIDLVLFMLKSERHLQELSKWDRISLEAKFREVIFETFSASVHDIRRLHRAISILKKQWRSCSNPDKDQMLLKCLENFSLTLPLFFSDKNNQSMLLVAFVLCVNCA